VGVGDSSSFAACFFFSGSGVSLGEGFAVVSLLCLAAFAFGVGLGDSSGDVDAAARALRICARFSFSSSVNCAWTSVPMIPLRARAVATQRRKRTTAAQRNRASGAINSRKLWSQAACSAGAGVGGVASRSRSRRRTAFNLPPRSRSKQVRYIQVSNMIMDASAR